REELEEFLTIWLAEHPGNVHSADNLMALDRSSGDSQRPIRRIVMVDGVPRAVFTVKVIRRADGRYAADLLTGMLDPTDIKLFEWMVVQALRIGRENGVISVTAVQNSTGQERDAALLKTGMRWQLSLPRFEGEPDLIPILVTDENRRNLASEGLRLAEITPETPDWKHVLAEASEFVAESVYSLKTSHRSRDQLRDSAFGSLVDTASCREGRRVLALFGGTEIKAISEFNVHGGNRTIWQQGQSGLAPGSDLPLARMFSLAVVDEARRMGVDLLQSGGEVSRLELSAWMSLGLRHHATWRWFVWDNPDHAVA
ncbi:MAG: hypothetical protein MH204_03170, partial [Fimbriimonadaceae bacterium]|nr:hypothetical protein [Fimbriimonadaceae bacterium]